MSWLGNMIPNVIGDIGGLILGQKEGNRNRQQQDQANQQNYDLQKEFAQNGIRWKIADGIAAGIHPLAVLGAQGYSASPSYISHDRDDTSSTFVRNMGQNISRAMAATSTMEEKMFKRAQLESMSIDNELKKTQLKKALMDLASPPLPSGSDNGAGVMDNIWGKADKNQTSVELPTVPNMAFSDTGSGLRPVMSRALSQADQNNMSNNLFWQTRNVWTPFITGTGPGEPPNQKTYPLPKGYDYYKWNRWEHEWQPARYQDSRRGFFRRVFNNDSFH